MSDELLNFDDDGVNEEDAAEMPASWKLTAETSATRCRKVPFQCQN